MTLHIGIVGCSAEGAALCYKTICTEASEQMGAHAHPEISMHTPSLSRYVELLEHGDVAGVAELMLCSARILAGCGADFLICPDNTIHQAFDMVSPHSPKPWLHIGDVVASEAARRNFKKVGITGTDWLVRSNVYPAALARHGVSFGRPNNAQIKEMGRIIMDQLVYGVFRPESITYFQRVIETLRTDGCDAVALACTEIPLIISDENSCLPTLDSNRLLARAAIAKAISVDG